MGTATRSGSPISASGRNLDSGVSCGFPAGHLNSTPALLEPLANRGGPTDTLAPMTESLARDAAVTCHPEGTDQRGVAAPTGTACDIGATELAADIAATLTAARSSVAPGGDVTYIARVVNNGVDAAAATALDVTLPAGAELVLAAPSDGACAGSHCDIGLLAPGASATVALVARAPATGPFDTGVAATSAHPDPNAADNGASVTTPSSHRRRRRRRGGGGGGTGPGGGADPARRPTAPRPPSARSRRSGGSAAAAPARSARRCRSPRS